MGEKKFNYTATIAQPQKVAGINIDPKGGVITERQLKALKKDAYGASLLESGMLTTEEVKAEAEAAPAASATGTEAANETNSDAPEDKKGGDEIPDFDAEA